MRNITTILAALSLGYALAGVTHAAPTYNVVPLAALPAGTVSMVAGINDSGQVVGSVNADDGTTNTVSGFICSSAGMQDLDNLGQAWTIPQGINASGQVAGYGYNAAGNFNAFLFSNGAMQNLGLVNGDDSLAWGINDQGQVVGGLMQGIYDAGAFLYNNGSAQVLATLGGTAGWASAINNSGQITGYSYLTGNVAHHAFLYSNGTMNDLGTLGGSNSEASAISAGGEVVGFSYLTGNSTYHAFLYNNGTMQDLGSLGGDSAASSINVAGQIVGVYAPAGSNPYDYWYPFLYEGGTMYDLNSLLTPGSGWTIANADGINDSGCIAAIAYQSGSSQEEVVLLTPSPEPASLVVLALGAATVLRRRSSRPR